MAKGALDDLKAMRERNAAPALVWKGIKPRVEEIAKATGTTVASQMPAATHTKDAQVRGRTHKSGYLGLAAKIRHIQELGATDAEVAELIGEAVGGKGGKARAAKMTPEQRSESASTAAKKRWDRG